jgi:hypothetical protein
MEKLENFFCKSRFLPFLVLFWAFFGLNTESMRSSAPTSAFTETVTEMTRTNSVLRPKTQKFAKKQYKKRQKRHKSTIADKNSQTSPGHGQFFTIWAQIFFFFS